MEQPALFLFFIWGNGGKMRSWKSRTAICGGEVPARIRRECGLPEWMAALLISRGADTPEKVRAFLNPGFEQLHAPQTLPGAADCVRVLEKLRMEKPHARVAVYGDYDTDGVCASVIMKEALENRGFRARIYIPDRHEEGYGLNENAVRRLKEDSDAILTVDCGITSIREAALAKSLGMVMIVTDHHTVGEELPPADAVVSPLLEGAPFRYLCGAGVALKLAWALCGEAFARDRLDLCALATVADLVSLREENRAIVALGIRKMIQNPRTGIRALMDAAGLSDRMEAFSSDSIAFQLAPRLNAAGRLESAMLSCRLLATEDADEAAACAKKLNDLNEARKEKQEKVIREAREQAAAMDLKRLRALVCFGEDWDSGVVGLAAGKLADQFDCPAVCLTRSGDDLVGSARSACGIDLYAALDTCRDLFIRFGGHRAAAGLTLRGACLDEFRERLSAAVEDQLGGRELKGETAYDSELTVGQLTEETVDLLSALAPFGMDNPSPLVVIRDAQMDGMRTVGRDGRHLQCTFSGNGAQRKGIFFGGSAWMDKPSGYVDVLGAPAKNTFRGSTSIQIQVTELRMRPDQLLEEESRELDTLWQDLSLAAANNCQIGTARRASPEEAAAWMGRKRGTLVLCRGLETARSWCARFPEADFLVGGATDPRAFTAVALYCPLEKIHPGYDRVLFADGAFSGEEELLALRIPGLRAMETEGKTQALLGALTVNREELLGIYSALKRLQKQGELHGLSRDRAAREASLDEKRLRTGLRLLRDAELVLYEWEPFSAALLPFRKSDPAKTPLAGWVYRP